MPQMQNRANSPSNFFFLSTTSLPLVFCTKTLTKNNKINFWLKPIASSTYNFTLSLSFCQSLGQFLKMLSLLSGQNLCRATEPSSFACFKMATPFKGISLEVFSTRCLKLAPFPWSPAGVNNYWWLRHDSRLPHPQAWLQTAPPTLGMAQMHT